MATAATPYGARPVGSLSANGSYTGRVQAIPIASAYATSIFHGDFVKLETGGTIELDVGTAALTPVGIFMGCKYTEPSTSQPTSAQFWTGGTVATDAIAYVLVDPFVVFEIQCSDAAAQTVLGANCEVDQVAGSTTIGLSRNTCDASTAATTNTFPVKVIGFVDSPYSTVGDAFTDVMIGNENAAGDVQKFFDAFRQLFPDCLILVLHHANKPVAGVTRSSAQRARGSTNIMAQVYSAFFVEALPKSKREFTIEQTKAGDADKLNKFSVELDVQPIEGTNKTKVVGILHKGEIYDQEVKTQKAVELIEESFKSTTKIPRQDLIDIALGNFVSQITMERAIKDLKKAGVLKAIPDENNKSKRVYIYMGNGESDSGDLISE